MCIYSDMLFRINMEAAVQQTHRLILSPAPSHRPAVCVATHWSATLTQVIVIHHLDWLNTFL